METIKVPLGELDHLPELEHLFIDAGLYAQRVIESLSLDPDPNEPPPEDIDPEDAGGLDLRILVRSSGLAAQLKAGVWMIYFMFPNLTDDERALLWALRGKCRLVQNRELKASKRRYSTYEREQATADAERFREEVIKAREAVAASGLESKLTALQMAVLDSSYLDPNSSRAVGAYFPSD